MILSISKTFEFDAAHHLPNYEGKCKNIHGHRFKLEVEISGTVKTEGPYQGMIMDFGILKQFVNDICLNKLDHNDLNQKFQNPTAELMVKSLAKDLSRALIELDCGARLKRLRLYETPTSYAQVIL